MTVSPLARLGADWQARWRTWPAAWRRAAVVALIGAIALAGWQMVWGPAWRQWRDGPARLAQQREAVAALQRDAAALARWRQVPDATLLPPTPEQAREALLTTSRRWLGPQVRVAAADGGWDIVFEGARAEDLAAWLVELRTTLGLSVVRAQWTRDPASGRWQGSVTASSGAARDG